MVPPKRHPKTPLRTLQDADMERRIDRMRRDKRRRTAGVVYFLKCEAFVKEGYSENPKSRPRALEVMCPFPCEIMGTISGGLSLENDTHLMIMQHHHKGE
jgi:hypothetical protein